KAAPIWRYKSFSISGRNRWGTCSRTIVQTHADSLYFAGARRNASSGICHYASKTGTRRDHSEIHGDRAGEGSRFRRRTPRPGHIHLLSIAGARRLEVGERPADGGRRAGRFGTWLA